MFRLMQLLGHRHSDAATAPKGEPSPQVSLWVITQDQELYQRLADIVGAWNWEIRKETDLYSFSSARNGTAGILIVMIDSAAMGGSWKAALSSLSKDSSDPCVILISPVLDDYLRREVIRCGGYDVVGKTESREPLMRALRFAWFWKQSLLRLNARLAGNVSNR
ncbi:MAG: hypothetical protein KGN84_16950 [Acidobacteriota bacterium]|nr:hypothetical protein [Acidobacteriota bacterium]